MNGFVFDALLAGAGQEQQAPAMETEHLETREEYRDGDPCALEFNVGTTELHSCVRSHNILLSGLCPVRPHVMRGWKQNERGG